MSMIIIELTLSIALGVFLGNILTSLVLDR